MIRVSIIYEKALKIGEWGSWKGLSTTQTLLTTPSFLNVTGTSTFDYDHYKNEHMTQALRDYGGYEMRTEVDRVICTPDNSPSPIHCIGYLYFNTVEEAREALTGPPAIAGGPDMANYYSAGRPTVIISEVEEPPAPT